METSENVQNAQKNRFFSSYLPAWLRSSRLLRFVLELELPDGVRAKELDVDVVEGWLYVQRTSAAAEADAAPPLLFGRLAQSHLASELMWAVDTLSDGRQMLCITLPKKERGRLGAASADCIFDESLHIRGEPCLQAGLSQGTITLDEFSSIVAWQLQLLASGLGSRKSLVAES